MRDRTTSLLHTLLVVSLGLSELLGAWPQTFVTAKQSPHADQRYRQQNHANDGGHDHRKRADKHQRSSKDGNGKHQEQKRREKQANGDPWVSGEASDGGTSCGDLERAPQPVGEGCSHGPDPAPPGYSVDRPVSPLSAHTARVQAAEIACDGDGQSGFRVEVLYVRGAEVASRFGEFLPSFRTWAGDADAIFQASAAETGGVRSLRFVQDAACQPAVTEVVVSPDNIADFWSTVADLQAQGFNRTDRIYLMFADADALCGYGSLWPDDQPGAANANNQGPSYSRVDTGCWSGALAAHELMHNLGGVQNSSPHASGGFHCIDEYDVMCYSDWPDYPAMQFGCPSEQQKERFDCGHDDYFSTSPAAGSYLDTHWNTANNRFLIGAPNAPNRPPSQPLPPQIGVETQKGRGSGQTVTLSATVNASVDVQSIQFGVCTGENCSWEATRPLGEVRSSPYQMPWKLPKNGTFSFFAQATYADDTTAISEPLTMHKKAKKPRSKGHR